jgi:hypothetical protein
MGPSGGLETSTGLHDGAARVERAAGYRRSREPEPRSLLVCSYTYTRGDRAGCLGPKWEKREGMRTPERSEGTQVRMRKAKLVRRSCLMRSVTGTLHRPARRRVSARYDQGSLFVFRGSAPVLFRADVVLGSEPILHGGPCRHDACCRSLLLHRPNVLQLSGSTVSHSGHVAGLAAGFVRSTAASSSNAHDENTERDGSVGHGVLAP